MDKGFLCDGCGDREPVVYCEECSLYFCEECDAYLHSGKSAGAKMYSAHARKSVSKEGAANPSAAAAEKVLSQKREIDETIARVSAEYSELSAKSAQQSRDFLEETLGAYLKALSQAKADAEGVLREARARLDFLEAIKASSNATTHETYEDNDDNDDEEEDREALLSIARMHTTSALEQRLTATTKAIGGITSRYSQATLPAPPDDAALTASAKRALTALLSEECAATKEALIHDDRFFPGAFCITLDFAVEHTFAAPAADAAPAAPRAATLAWKAPALLSREKPLFLVELRLAAALGAPYRACYSGPALACALEALEPGKCYEARVTALRAPGERLPYASAPHKIAVPENKKAGGGRGGEKKEKKMVEEVAKGGAPSARAAKKTFYQGFWSPPPEGGWGYDFVGDGCAVQRNARRAGDYVIGICDQQVDVAAGVATAWTFEVEGIDAESHLYMGLCPMEAVVAEAGSDVGYFFCATCGALKMDGGEHVDLSDCPKGSVKSGSRVGFEFSSDGKSGTLVISVNRMTVEKRIDDIPLDVPLFPAIVCKSGRVRINS